MEQNRLVELVKELDSKNIRNPEGITKQILEVFGCKFRINRIEADYITSYANGELNFTTKIIDLQGKKVN